MVKYSELPQKWKRTIKALVILNALAIVLFLAYSFFLSSYRAKCAALRAPLKKDDSQLIGERVSVPREGKAPVSVNLYLPEKYENDSLPVVFNIHGGGFVGGDADMLDTQSDRIANEWSVIVVTVNYTTADVKPVSYGSEEIKDAVLYFAENAESYHADPERFTIMGYSAGAYYAAESVRMLKKDGFAVDSLVMCYPWTTGLPTKELSSDHPRTLFVLAGEDPISQKSKTYMDAMKAAGITVEAVEYEGAVHSFIESNNPEGVNDTSTDLESVINPTQERLAREAEKFVGEWLAQ